MEIPLNHVSLHDPIAAFIRGRGRWLRAGQDNLPGHLSKLLKCGPNRVDEIIEILRAPSDVLHVEHHNGRIRRVGLSVWLTQPTGAHGELDLDDVDAMWALVADLYAENAVLSAHKADIDEMLQLAVETEQENVSLHEELDVLRKAPVRSAEITSSKEPCGKCATLEGTLTTLRGNYSAKCDELRALEKVYQPLKWMLEHPESKVLLDAMKVAARQLPSLQQHLGHHHLVVVAPLRN